MSEIKLYDIITLENDLEYTILKILNKNSRVYYLIAPIDQEENPNMENIKIVECKTMNNQIIIQDVIDYDLLKELSKIFLKSLEEDLD